MRTAGELTASAIAFAAPGLDRADHVRADPRALAALRAAGARRLRLEHALPAVTDAGALAWDDGPAPDEDGEWIFLGLDAAGRGCFVAAPPMPPPPGATPGEWRAMTLLAPGELAIYGAARALAGWHARHRFCAACGASTRLAKGGWQRTCVDPRCAADHFPRVDPVTIMLVEHGAGGDARALLGRQPRWPPRRYSVLAGFVEPGETIEQAVAREVFEETGVRAREVRYVATQPWPFPASLMIGCAARADDDAIALDAAELEDARWFTRDEVAEALAAAARGAEGRAFAAPPPSAIANHLLRWWLAHG